MAGHNIIVIGASAGGVEAMIKLLPEISANIPAAIFLVLHIPAQNPQRLPDIFSRYTSLTVQPVIDGEQIKPGHLYVAPPDYHLLIEVGRVKLIRGPKENRYRPAIDPLFRSAAIAYGSSVIGVVLTGSLDDGTAGLLAIKRRGGIAVVQDPKDALFPSMPLNASQNVQVDFSLPLVQIAPLLEQLSQQEPPNEQDYPITAEMGKEGKTMEMELNTLNNDAKIGTPSVFSCPECSGVLWELHDEHLIRYRCRIGHAYSAESMAAEKTEALETALWIAFRTLEESASLSRRMAEHAAEHGQFRVATRFTQREQDAMARARIIRDVLLKSETSVELENTDALNIPPDPENQVN